MTYGPSSSGSQWKSEEDYVLARLAVALGLLDHGAVTAGLDAQGQLWARGERLSLSQVLVRERRLRPEHLLTLKAELARLVRACPQCGLARYLAAGPAPRVEPCPRCGAGVPVPGPTPSLTPSAMDRRQGALRPSTHGASGFGRDPFVVPEGDAPKVFAHWVIEAEVARGGMGAIYRARHATTGQVVALKVVLAGDRASEAQVHRFKREAKAQLELQHPGIVRIHEVGEWEGILHYAMDLVDGPDLAKAMPAIELPERVRILAQVARAIQHAHEAGYVHRDLKPANVLLAGPERRPLLTDFGLAKNLGGETRLTKEGQVLGTPYYMAPEQATGQTSRIGPRSDVYSLGVMLYELVTGELPFLAEAALELYQKIVEERPKSFAERGALEPALETICFKAMAKDPDDRYASAAELACDLERHLAGEAPLADRETSLARVARRVEKHKRSIGAILGLGVVGMALLVGLALAGKAAHAALRDERLKKEREAAATLAATALDKARGALPPGGEEPPGPDAGAAERAALDAALATARELLAQAPEQPELRTATAAALVARAEAALSLRRGDAARAAAALADEALALKPEGEVRAAALLVRVRAARRTNDGSAPAVAALEAALAAARADVANDSESWPRLALEEGLALLDQGGPPSPGEPPADAALVEKALGPLEVAAGARETAPAGLAARARALLALGRDAPAEQALTLARAAQGVGLAAIHRRVAEALTLAGERREAAGEWRVALEAEPGHGPTARRLMVALMALGRPVEARRLVEPALRAEAPGLRALLLRARLLAGEPLTNDQEPTALQRDLRALAAGDVDAMRLLLDVLAVPSIVRASKGQGPAPEGRTDRLAERDPALRAARARDRAARSDATGAKADLEALAPALADVPRDLPPDAADARLARDAGWTALALGDPARATALARLALRGLPDDPDGVLLLHRAGAAPAARVAAALAAERDELEGGLGRGLLVGRLATLYDPRLADEARWLLDARRAGDPGLEAPLRAELEALRLAELGPDEGLVGSSPRDGLVQPPSPADLAPFEGALWPRPAWPPAASPAAIAEVASRVGPVSQLERERDREALAELNALRTLDPNSLQVIWELGSRNGRRDDADLEQYLGWYEYLQRDPGHMFSFILKNKDDWVRAYVYRPEPPNQLCVAFKDPAKPETLVPDLIERYFGVLYPVEDKPRWTATDPAALRADLDRLLARDARWACLLYLRAHLAAVARDGVTAQRDLALVSQLARAQLDRDRRPSTVNDDLYRLWILASVDPEAALRILPLIEKAYDLGGTKYAARALAWVKTDPHLQPLRGAGAWPKFVERYTPR